MPRKISKKTFAMAGAISNSSTLLNLAIIGRLSLLREFHEKIIVPPAVWQEVVIEGRGRAGAAEVEAAHRAGWIEIVRPKDQELLKLLKRDLDDGESEAIALAVQQNADIVFLDEADARQIALLYGLRKSGVVGVMVRAKQQGMLPSLKAELDRLRHEAGFWIAEELYQQALREVGEAT